MGIEIVNVSLNSRNVYLRGVTTWKRVVTIFREYCTVLGVTFHPPLDWGLYLLAVSSKLLPKELEPQDHRSQDREMNVEINFPFHRILEISWPADDRLFSQEGPLPHVHTWLANSTTTCKTNPTFSSFIQHVYISAAN
jgi:hypothetical protein